MNELEPTWWPALLALAAGSLAGVWAALMLRQQGGSDAETQETILDLDEQAAHLIRQLRDLDEQRSRLPEARYVAEKGRLELAAAQAIRDRDQQAAGARAPRDAAAEEGAGLERRPWLRLGGGLVVASLVGLLAYVGLESQSHLRADGASMTGGGPAAAMGPGAPAGMGTGGEAATLDGELTMLMERLEASPTDLEALLRLSHRLLGVHDGSEATLFNDRALALAPDNLEAKTHAAVLQARGDNPAAGMAALDGLLRDNPTYAEAWFYRGMLGVDARDIGQLVESWKKFLEFAPEGPDKERVRQVLAQAEAHAKAGVEPMIAQSLAQGAPPVAAGGELPPDHPGVDGSQGAAATPSGGDGSDLAALLRQAHELLRSQRIAEADALTRQALALDPNNTEARVHAAVIKSAGGDLVNALAMLDGVLQDDPKQAEAWFFRGMMGMRSGNTELAHASWRKFVDVAPDGPQKERIRGFLAGEGMQMPQP